MVHEGITENLLSLTYASSTNIVKETLWAFSNLAAGSPQHAAKIFTNQTVSNRILVLMSSPSAILASEASWVMANAITTASQQDIHEFL